MGFPLLLAFSCAPIITMGAGAAADPARRAATACAAGNTDGECDVVDLLQHGVTRHMDKREGAFQQDQRPLALALVDEVFTYGAPATHQQPFRNAATEDGCFPGLRSYTEDLLGAMKEIHQVDAAAMNNFYPHAFIDSVVLHSGFDSYYTPCNGSEHGHPDWPTKRAAQFYEEWRIHHEANYQGRLDHLTVNSTDLSEEEPFKTARKYVLFAFKSYDTVANTKSEMSERTPDWSLVQWEVFKSLNDEDPVLVMQQAETLDCALVFTGSNNAADFPASTTQWPTAYCGFDGVHKGYRDELWSITVSLWEKVRPTLEQCNKVACVGHSLGGALCELFAACANSGNTTDPDFQALVWEKAKSPRRMPSIEG